MSVLLTQIYVSKILVGLAYENVRLTDSGHTFVWYRDHVQVLRVEAYLSDYKSLTEAPTTTSEPPINN